MSELECGHCHWYAFGRKPSPCGNVPILVKLYVDDQRPPPEGWCLATSVDDAVAVLRQGTVTELSLDFDLGDARRGTGVHVLRWLERALEQGQVPLPRLEAHSGSPVGRRRLQVLIDDLVRRFGST